MEVQFIPHHQISKSKWDVCIQHAENGLLYAETVFLDAMTPGWHALIYGDYEAVMPVTWRSKFGISYLCQPAFAQQLGVFTSPQQFIQDLLPRFLIALTRRYKLVEVYVNHHNLTEGITGQHQNFILNLNPAYTQIAAGYKTDLQKNLARATKFNLYFSSSNDLTSAIQLYRDTYGKNMGVRPVDYIAFTQLCQQLMATERAFVRQVTLPTTGELLATGVFLKDERRIYNLASTTLPNGRTLEANHWLFDQLIREFAGSDLILDFEGSDIRGIANFYQKFGAVNQPYFFWKSNRLPAAIRWWKR